MFRRWLSKEEKKWRKKKDAVHEAKLLKKFGGLNFYDPHNNVMCTVHTGNIEWEKRHGYVALGVKGGDTTDMRPSRFGWGCCER